jgi:hypothetical protein
MRRRAGAHVRQKAREAMWAKLVPIRWAVLQASAIAGLTLVAANAVLSRFLSAWMRGATVGSMVTSFVLAVVYVLMTASGQQGRVLGADAEQDTASELRKLGTDYAVFHDLVFWRDDSMWNVDHVVVGRSTVCAIETKYRSPSTTHRRWAAMMTDASLAARTVSLRLLAETKFRIAVRPVVAFWGDSTAELPLTDGERTTVVAGDSISVWLNEQDRGDRIPVDQRQSIIQALEKLMQSADDRLDRQAVPNAIVLHGPGVILESLMVGMGVIGFVLFALGSIPLAPLFWVAAFGALAVAARACRSRVGPRSRVRVWLRTGEVVWGATALLMAVWLTVVIVLGLVR